MRQAPDASRCAKNTRSGAAFAQCTRRSVSFCGNAGSGCGERSTMAPSLRRSTTTSAGLSKTRRSGGFADVSSVFVAVSVIVLAARDFGTTFFQKSFHPRLGLVVALRDRRGERLGGETGGGIAAGDARQDVHHGVIGERRIAGDLVGEFKTLGKTFAVVDEIMGEPDRLAFLGGERAAGEHHVHDACG